MSAPAPQPNPDYLTGLGLQRAPFLDQVDDRFFYADPMLTQRLDLLQHLTQFGDMLLGVSGPAGSGKSTLLQQILLRGGTTWRCCRLNGGQLGQPGELLTQLADCFGLDRNAAPERLKTDLLRLCQTLRHNAQTAVVIIDDAQSLPDPVLKTLLELGGDPRETLKHLRVILFSEPGLEQRLIQAGWHSSLQPLLHNLDVPGFDDHQTAAYLMYRLAVAGYSGESPFSLTEIRALHKAAGGRPGRLNVLAHELLMERGRRLAARPPGAGVRGPSVPRRTVLTITALGILVLGGLAWYLSRPVDEAPREFQSRIDSEPENLSEPPVDVPPGQPPVQSVEDGNSVTAPLAGESATDVARPAAPGTPTPAAENNAPPSVETPAPVTPAPLTPSADETPAPGEKTTAKTTADTREPPPEPPPESAPPAQEPAGTALTETPTPPTATPQNTAQPSAPTAPELPPSAAASTPAPVTMPAVPSPSDAVTAPPDTAADRAATGPVAQEAKEPAATPDATPPTARPTASRPPVNLPADVLGSDWLLERPAGHFTLQLLGVRSASSLRAYLRQHDIPAPVAYFRTRYKGGDWYVIVQGDYPSTSAARAAVAELPADIRMSKPWPRTFANVHADIRRASP